MHFLTSATVSVAMLATLVVGITTDQQKALDLHNAARKAVGCNNLTWDGGLAADAQAWANKLVAKGKFEHSQGTGQGENLAMQYPANGAYPNSVNQWLAEKQYYNGQPISQNDYQKYGHYTQCVWRGTTKLGMGSKVDSRGYAYTVARYSPPGNYLGQKAY